jgi:hypothetical protein
VSCQPRTPKKEFSLPFEYGVPVWALWRRESFLTSAGIRISDDPEFGLNYALPANSDNKLSEQTKNKQLLGMLCII